MKLTGPNIWTSIRDPNGTEENANFLTYISLMLSYHRLTNYLSGLFTASNLIYQFKDWVINEKLSQHIFITTISSYIITIEMIYITFHNQTLRGLKDYVLRWILQDY